VACRACLGRWRGCDDGASSARGSVSRPRPKLQADPGGLKFPYLSRPPLLPQKYEPVLRYHRSDSSQKREAGHAGVRRDPDGGPGRIFGGRLGWLAVDVGLQGGGS
jgi:hypothetical protein